MVESKPEPTYPFRWDVTKRSQLGRLIGAPSGDRDAYLDWLELTAHSYRWHSMYPYSWFLNELALCAARVVALCDNSDLCFVGRSPESLFDYLSGLLLDTSWAERVTLLHFSVYKANEEIVAKYLGALKEIRKYLAWAELDPQALARRQRPVAFVDIVASGETLGALVGIIHSWCEQASSDWNAIRRNIRIVGLTERTETSPKTWRWQQHADWADMLARGSIKNVSIPVPLFHFLGEGQPKTTESYHPRLWGDPAVLVPTHNEERLRALRVAAALFDDGRDKDQRLRFAAELSKQSAMRYSWVRSLVGELKGFGG